MIDNKEMNMMEEKKDKTLQQVVQHILDKHNITRAQLSRDIGGMSPVLVSQWMANRCLPTDSTLKRISETYGVPHEEIFRARDLSRLIKHSPSYKDRIMHDPAETYRPNPQHDLDDPHPARTLHVDHEDLPTNHPVFSTAAPASFSIPGRSTLVCKHVARIAKGTMILLVVRKGEVKVDAYDPDLHNSRTAYKITAIIPAALCMVLMLAIAAGAWAAPLVQAFRPGSAPTNFHGVALGSPCPTSGLKIIWSANGKSSWNAPRGSKYTVLGTISNLNASVYLSGSNLTGFSVGGDDENIQDAFRCINHRFSVVSAAQLPEDTIWTNTCITASFTIAGEYDWYLTVAIRTNSIADEAEITQF